MTRGEPRLSPGPAEKASIPDRAVDKFVEKA